MSAQFLSKLSQNFIELLKDDEYYDITIEVGEDPNVKIFRAHMNILSYRSPYLQRALASRRNNDNILAHITFSNISPEIFQTILRYIYGGILSLNEQTTSEIINILVAANILHLQELVDYLQKYLIENNSGWIEQHFELIHQTSFQSNNLLELQQFCTDLMANSPEKIFNSFDFTSLPEKSLDQLIKRDDLQMKEIEVWDRVLKWGLAQNSTLIPDPDTWSDDDFKSMKITLQHCLPLIRFFSLSSKEFLDKVRPYEKLLRRQLYQDVLNSHLDPDSEPSDNISLPRNIKIDRIIDSKIVKDLSIVSTISRWIDKMVITNNFAHLKEPYKFELLLRGSRDGFTPIEFHKLCDDKPNTVTFIKVNGTGEILGGYNPLKWSSSNFWGKTKDSFIFSFKNENKFILSSVKNTDQAIANHPENGPCFGEDIIIYASNESTNYNTIYCGKAHYENGIRDVDDNFLIEDYEVFQIIRK